VRTVSVKLMADVSDFTRQVGGKAAGSVKSLAGELDKANSTGKLDRVTTAATGLGLGLVGAAVAAVKMGMDFDKSMSGIQAATHASAGDMDSLRKAAIKAGADTQYSATEAADAITELSKAGIGTSDILSGGLNGALSLAAAGEMDVGDAAETAASALTQFGLKGKDVPHVADLLAAAAGKAQGSVADMSQALNQSGLIASATGLTIEDTTGTLAAFASAGLIGSDAGTSFKTMLQALQAPSGKTKDLMDNLGISAYDAGAQFIGITEVRRPAEGQAIEADSGDARERRGADLRVRRDPGRERALHPGLRGHRPVDRQDQRRRVRRQYGGDEDRQPVRDIERLKGSLDTLLIQGGSGPQAALRMLAQALTGVVNSVGAMNPLVVEGAVVIAGLTGAAILGGVAWLKYRAFVAEVNEQLIATGPAGAKAAAGLTKVQSVMGKVAIAAVAIEGMKQVFEAFGPATADVTKLTASLQQYADTGQAAGEMTLNFGKNMDDFKGQAGLALDETNSFTKGVNNLLNTIGAGAVTDWLAGLTGTDSLNIATSNMNAYDDALTQVMTTSGDAAKASQLWRDALERSGLDTEQLAKVLPDAWAEVGKLNQAADSATTTLTGTSGAEIALANSTADTTEQQKQQKEASDALEKSVQDLFKQYMSADQAQIALRDTTKSTNAELKKGAKTISLNTDEGRKNRKAVLDQVQAIEDLREKQIAAGTSTDKANGTYVSQIGALKKNLIQLGFNKKGVSQLIDKYKDIPPSVNTKVTMTGDKAVGQKLSLMSQIQTALKKGTQLPAPARHMFDGYDAGGWTGPGGTYDVAGYVHADEHVIKKTSRRKLEKKHPGLLDYANAHGELPPGYATGGRVWPFPVTAAMTKVMSMKEAAAAVGGIGGPAGSGSLGAWISQALALTGAPGSWGGPLRTLVMRESGGNPRAINLWDSNAKAGHPSMGLAQTIGPTFEHYRLKSLPDDPYNPVANLSAAIRYIESRYGSIFRVQQANKNLPPKGYAGGGHVAMATGGVINEPVYGYGASGRSYSFGERGPETVIPGSRGGSGGGTTTTVYLTAQLAAGANIREAGRQLAEQLSSYLHAGGTVNIRGRQVLP
jgi:SLT domain-containing protein